MPGSVQVTEVEPRWKTGPVKKPKVDPSWADAREERLWWDRGLCQVKLWGCGGSAFSVHHRRPSDRRTGDHDQHRLVSVCLWCHGVIHDQPGWSVRHGWLLRSGTEGPYVTGCDLTCESDHRV
jgi:hypothetical protein